MGSQLRVSNQTMDPTHPLTQKSANLMPVFTLKKLIAAISIIGDQKSLIRVQT